MGFQYEMGALESLAAGADVGSGHSVNVMLDSTAEVQTWPIMHLAMLLCMDICHSASDHGMQKQQCLLLFIVEVAGFLLDMHCRCGSPLNEEDV